jgi:hypothetical protein
MPAALALVSCTDTISGSGINGADPGVLEAPIAFVKRPLPVDDNGNEIQHDLREPLFFAAGGDIYLRSNSTVTATELNITAAVTGGQGDVKDLKPSFDGTRLLFSLRLFDPNPNDDDTPSWNIYEYALQENTLRRIISNDLTAEQGDDVAPAFLPDGRIVFSSNRQRQSGEMLTNEGKPRFRALDEDEDTMAMVLHVMNDDGGNLHQISFNQSHDLDPTVLSSSYPGEVLFTRWDNAAASNAMHLYKINPDGTELQVLYGVHSHDTGANNAGTDDSTIQFSQAEEMQDGRIMVLTRPYTGTYDGGNIVIIDIENFVDQTQSVTGMPGPAQTSATINNISAANEISAAGRYSAAYPLWDDSNRILVSKSSCELNLNGTRRACIEPYLSDINAVEVSPAYGIWLYDMSNNSEKIIIVAEQGMVITDIVALQSRPAPVIKSTTVPNSIWADEGMAAIHIKSVYDFGDASSSASFDGCFLTDCSNAAGINSVNDLANPANATADQRPARFVRLLKAVALPDRNDPDLGNDAPDLNNAAFGPSRNQGMREIIGYAPVEPDGSVKVKVPANIPLAISVLDKFGRRIGARHQNWFQLRPGDTMQCTGCHTHNTANNATPNVHHRSDAEAPSINSGVPASGVFENTRIPGTTDIYFGNPGETMAEVRFRLAATEPQLSADIIYEDVWTNPDVRPADTAFSYEYANLATPLPASSNCLQDAAAWDFKCRILINYVQHIHPLWSLPRGIGDADTCTNCHTNFDSTLMLDKVPDAQLDLSAGFSDQQMARFKSYRELFFTDAGEQLDATGSLENIQIEVPILDANGAPALDINGIPLTEFIDDPNAGTLASMSANGARVSYFMEKMTETELNAGRSLLSPGALNYLDHSAFMTADELRLISEWLDIAAQYFNDPFDPAVPMN